MVHNDETYDDLAYDELVKRHCDWLPEAFEAFWAEYPLKFNKVHAMRAWDRLRLPEQELRGMMSCLEAYKLHGKFARPENPDEVPFYEAAGDYFRMWNNILPADSFLLDQPWVV